jgi:hypothetical protein
LAGNSNAKKTGELKARSPLVDSQSAALHHRAQSSGTIINQEIIDHHHPAMPSCGGVEWARKLQGRLPENIPAGLAIAFLVAAIVLPIIRPAVSAGPQARAETLKPLEAEFMKAAADEGSRGSTSYDADESVELPNGGRDDSRQNQYCQGHEFPRR